MMSETARRGISLQGLDAAFDAEEARCGNLLIEAQMLQAQGKADAAAARYAAVAPLEEHLGAVCEEKGLLDKSWVHRFGAVRAWALAGNYHAAITAGDALLNHPQLPERLRQHVQEYTQSLRARRDRWAAELAVPVGGVVPDPQTGGAVS
jgi:hypothetical protein